MNIGSLFTRHALYRSEHTALVCGEQRLTWSAFNRRINRVANALMALGIGKGDHIATLLPNCQELLEVYWSAAKIGAVVVPLSTLLRPSAIANLLEDADARIVVTDASFCEGLDSIRGALSKVIQNGFLLTDTSSRPGFLSYHDLCDQAAPTEPSGVTVGAIDPFNIMYSSGTTGMPKGIVHTHAVRVMYGTCFAAAFRMTPECVTLHAGAIVFNGAFVDLMPTIFVGGTYVLMAAFDPVAYIETVAREQVTHVMLVPAQIVALLNAPNFDPSKLVSLEMILSLGAPLLMEHKEMLNEVLPGRFYELYGLTEGFVTVLDREDYRRKPQSVGCPPPLFEMRIVGQAGDEVGPGTVGEICGRGPILMSGYYKRPDLTQEAIRDGWLHSGDLGYCDEDGFLYLVDRVKDMIISGGVNVYPRDIEEIAVQHPAVQEVAVFGIPHPKWGETPVAVVTLNRDASASETDLRDWINERVGATFQRLAYVVILETFPCNVAGKVLKRELRERYRSLAD